MIRWNREIEKKERYWETGYGSQERMHNETKGMKNRDAMEQNRILWNEIGIGKNDKVQSVSVEPK